MNTPLPLSSRSLMATAIAALSLSAQAMTVGIDPLTTPVINPFTGLSTDVWKLVGRASGCTAELITPRWVLSSKHCAAAGNYTNDHLAPGQAFPLMNGQTLALPQDPQWPICAAVTEPHPLQPGQRLSTDMFICRLADTAPAPYNGPFPPLVAGPIRGASNSPTLPTHAQLADRSAHYGSLMLYGHGNGGNKVAFIGFNGLPHGYSPITDPSGATIAALNGGDSGGGIYAYSSLTGQWALTGITTSPLQFLTEDAIAFIQTHIAQYGDTPPASVSSTSHYGDLQARSAADLPSPPTSGGVSGSTLIVRWGAPADSSVTSYNVSYGHDGIITGRLTVGATSPLQVSVPTSGSRYWTACVQALNARGPGNAAWVTSRYPAATLVTPGCSTFDMATPGGIGSVSMTAVRNTSTGLFKVSSSWAKPLVPNVAINAYRVNTTVLYPSGPKRVTTQDVTAPSSYSTVITGSTVCVSVSALSAAGVVGPASAQQCKVAR